MTAPTNSVLFADAKGQGFTGNLASLRDELLGRRPACAMRYFFGDLTVGETVPAKELRAMQRLLQHASAEAGWVVSASDSEHVRGCRGPSDQRRVLLLSPRLNQLDPTADTGEPILGYTDVVVPGSAFVSAAQVRFPGARVHAVGLPVFAELVSAGARARGRAQLAVACPRSEGKRIVVVTTQRTPEKVFGESGIRQLVERLPEDVFLVADVPGMLETLEFERADLGDRVFVNDGALGVFTMLALADALLTSQFRDAVYFSATGRELYLLNTRRNIGTLGDRLPDDYAGLGIADISELPAALSATYDEAARTQFQSVYAAPDPASSASSLIETLF